MSGKSVTAVYPGTFDPITLGHEDLVQRACGLFEHVIVAVAAGHHKKTMFTLEERLEMVRNAFAHSSQVSVQPFSGLVKDFVRANDAKVMVRGVRSGSDFDYEYQLAGMNRHLMPDVETIFLPPSLQYQYISSTFVREIASLHGDIKALVSPNVFEQVQRKVQA